MTKGAYSFLAVNAPVKADILVVEGWMTDEYHKGVVALFRKGGYRQILTTGGPLRRGHYLIQYRTYAELTAASLRALGVPKDRVHAVPAPAVKRNRTYRSAKAVQAWLDSHGLNRVSVNVVTLGAHARRTRLLYRMAMGPEHPVGVIPLTAESFDPARWWRYSAGVRLVIGEMVGYLYARLLFIPG